MSTLLDRTRNGLGSRGAVLSGLRGVGKTVLLNEMRSQAEHRDCFVVALEARQDGAGEAATRRTLGREIAIHARSLMPGRAATGAIQRALSSISAFNVKVGSSGIDLGVEVARGRADSGEIDVDLTELVEDLCLALAERQSAFLLFIDEMQDMDTSLLRALLVTQHKANQRGWPFYIIGAGLPNLPTVLTSARSYAERLFDYRSVGTLSDVASRSALADPVRRYAVEFAAPALDAIVDAARGYPYFLQEFGRAAWEVAAGPTIIASDARVAVELGLERLDVGFFASRWNRATPAERRMLVAMAEDGDGPSASGVVAQRLGIRLTSMGPRRANLIGKGLVYSPEHGQIAYTVPGMADYVHRHRENVSEAGS